MAFIPEDIVEIVQKGAPLAVGGAGLYIHE